MTWGFFSVKQQTPPGVFLIFSGAARFKNLAFPEYSNDGKKLVDTVRGRGLLLCVAEVLLSEAYGGGGKGLRTAHWLYCMYAAVIRELN